MNDVICAYRKTFLAGEYAACQYGRALLFNYGPTFILQPSSYWQLSQLGQRIIRTYGLTQHPKPMSFIDPLDNHGGVGASSAEVSCLYRWLHQTQIVSTEYTLEQQVAWYRKHTWSGEGLPPSGVDFLAQYQAGLIWIDVTQETCIPLIWPFKTFDCMVVKTRQKVATHEHLKSICYNDDFSLLDDYITTLYTTICNQQESRFFQVLRILDHTLQTMGLQIQPDPQEEQLILSCPGVIYRRGTGALGADTWLIFYYPSQRQALIQQLQSLGYLYMYPLYLEKSHANTLNHAE